MNGLKNRLSSESRVSIHTPINKVVSPGKKMNFAEEIRKSTIRVSMLK
jgi:hypothetical protein